MTRNGAIKTILFNLIIAILLIVFYHPNLIGLSFIDTGTLEMTCAVTFLPFLILLCVLGNRKLMKDGTADTGREYKIELINELNKYKTNDLFKNQVSLAIQQMETFETRKRVFKNVLNSNFKNDDNFNAFSNLIDNAEVSITNNCRIVLNSVSTFNYSEYKNFRNYNGTYSEEILRKKKVQHEEYFNELSNRLNQNANMLIEFDNLIMEANRINDSDSKNELNGLVDMVTAMKQLHFNSNDVISNLADKYKDQ